MRLVRLAFLSWLLLAAGCRDADRAPAVVASGSPAASTIGSSAALEEPAAIAPDEEPPPPPAPTPPAKPPLSEVELAAFFATPSAKITAEVFETTLLRLATCKIEPGWVNSCPAYGDLMKVVQRYKGGEGFPSELALRHLRHPVYAVRGSAVSFASPYAFEGGAERAQLYLDAMRSETDAEVLKSLVRYSGPGAANNAAIRRFVLRSLVHADESVRINALDVVARPDVAAQVPDVFDRIAFATRANHSRLERVAACAHMGKLDDARAVPLLASLLADDALPRDVRGACFEGLVGTWTRRPAPSKPSREGYELTMRILTAKPRSTVTPHERGVRALASAGTASSKWSESVRSFYDVRAVSSALALIVLDDDAAQPARSAAGVTLVELDQKEMVETTIKDLKKQGSPVALQLADEISKKLVRGPFDLRF